MKPIQLFHDGCGYGTVMTAVASTMMVIGTPSIRLRVLELEQLAMLAADLLGEEQPYTRHEVRNLARWVLRFGMIEFGERPFLEATARALIWRPDETRNQ